MMIKLTGGWISVVHAQSIEPRDKGCLVRLVDATVELEEDADVVAARINEVRAAILALASYATAGPECPQDVDDAVSLLRSLVAKHSEEEAADNGEEKSEG